MTVTGQRQAASTTKCPCDLDHFQKPGGQQFRSFSKDRQDTTFLNSLHTQCFFFLSSNSKTEKHSGKPPPFSREAATAQTGQPGSLIWTCGGPSSLLPRLPRSLPGSPQVLRPCLDNAKALD